MKPESALREPDALPGVRSRAINRKPAAQGPGRT